jgi:hypothetical protein
MSDVIKLQLIQDDNKIAIIEASGSWKFNDLVESLEQPPSASLHPKAFQFPKHSFDTHTKNAKKYQFIRPGTAWEKWLPTSSMTLAQASSKLEVERDFTWKNRKRSGPFELTIIPEDALLVLHNDQDAPKDTSDKCIIPYDLLKEQGNTIEKLMLLVSNSVDVRKVDSEPSIATSIQRGMKSFFGSRHYFLDQNGRKRYHEYMQRKVNPNFLTAIVVHSGTRPVYTHSWPPNFSFVSCLIFVMVMLLLLTLLIPNSNISFEVLFADMWSTAPLRWQQLQYSVAYSLNKFKDWRTQTLLY